MSALRVSQPGQPTRLIPVDTGCTPQRLGPYYLQGGTPVTAEPAGKKPLTPEQREAHNAKSRAYHAANAERALERQRRYRKRMKGVA